MEQFNLEEYKKNPNRKIATRDGRVVRIICCDAKNSKPIVALVLTRSISQREFDELTVSYFNDGTYYGKATEDFLDLFFADEEEGLTEFDKCLLSAFYSVAGKAVTTIGPASFQEDVNEWSKTLLDLAIKEEILKDLPKWKRVPKTWKVEDNAKVVFSEDYKYYIDKKELFKKLQKE